MPRPNTPLYSIKFNNKYNRYNVYETNKIKLQHILTSQTSSDVFGTHATSYNSENEN